MVMIITMTDCYGDGNEYEKINKNKQKITLLAYTITGRPSNLHCGPEINIQIEHNFC